MNLALIEHSLNMNHIQFIFTQTNKIKIIQWWSEEYIRAMPEEQRGWIIQKKVPDAIFWRLRKDGTKQKIFLECERSLKNKNRYEDIFQFYAKRHDVQKKNVIYICKDEFIRDKLNVIEKELAKSGKIESAGRYFQFITLSDFYKEMEINKPKKGATHESF